MNPAISHFAKAFKRMKLRMTYVTVMVFRFLPGWLYRNAADFGQSVSFSLWVEYQFGSKEGFVATRERLWKRIIDEVPTGTDVVVYEFGVAYGHATKWWLAHCPGIIKYYGFDTFKGLPEAWRHHQKWAFSAGGEPPSGISDSRIEWVAGRVQDTFSGDWLRAQEVGDSGKTKRVFIFDFDLYKPTQYVISIIFPQLREGGVLYFDEAADLDENRALLEIMDRSAGSVEFVGATPMALALRVSTNIMKEGKEC